jgi:hypothetical protein
MLTEVKAYSSWLSAPTLLLSDNGRPETDLIQVRNIDGLDPVKASVNTSPLGSVDGSVYTGGNVESRNIVLTVHTNPDWDVWSHESLRRFLYSYFMPKKPIKLEFYSDDMDPVQILGFVEDVQANRFTKDPEMTISVICPDPYFTGITPIVLTGQASHLADPVIVPVEYNGNVEAGIKVKVTWFEDPLPVFVIVQNLIVDATVGPDKYYEISSIPLSKYIQNVNIGSGVITNLLSNAQAGSQWPIFQPGTNEFSVVTDAGGQDWELTYFERYGGL